MSSNLPFRNRLSRQSYSSTPAQSSPLAASPSTPYDIYRSQHLSNSHPPQSRASGSTRSPFLEPKSPINPVTSLYRRNVGFGSPGQSATRSTASRQSIAYEAASSDYRSPRHSSVQKPATRFVRKKPWKQKLFDLPGIWYDQIVLSEYADFRNPAIGYPLGALLHFASVLVLAMHPSGSLRLQKNKGRGAGSLFAEQGSLAMRRQSQKDAHWRVMANLLMLVIVLAVLANAYSLWNSRKRYHFWMKPTSDVVQSDNAKLVNLPNDEGAGKTMTWSDRLHEATIAVLKQTTIAAWWLARKAIYQLRLVRYVGVVVRFFFPPSSGHASGRRSQGSAGDQMHAIDVWQAPEVQLRIFLVYSPLHLFTYLSILRSSDATRTSNLANLLYAIIVMTFMSAQLAGITYLFKGLVKDKQLIAGEVLNEYNQKFVMPRAMPVCRDASTMTQQAEWITREDLRPSLQNASEQNASLPRPPVSSSHKRQTKGSTDSNSTAAASGHSSASKSGSSQTRKIPKKGRSTAAI